MNCAKYYSRFLLLQVFYGVVTISDEELKSFGCVYAEFDPNAKFWCWTLTQFEKCVFLNSQFLVSIYINKININVLIGQRSKKLTKYVFVMNHSLQLRLLHCIADENLIKSNRILNLGEFKLRWFFQVWRVLCSRKPEEVLQVWHFIICFEAKSCNIRETLESFHEFYTR